MEEATPTWPQVFVDALEVPLRAVLERAGLMKSTDSLYPYARTVTEFIKAADLTRWAIAGRGQGRGRVYYVCVANVPHVVEAAQAYITRRRSEEEATALRTNWTPTPAEFNALCDKVAGLQSRVSELEVELSVLRTALLPA